VARVYESFLFLKPFLRIKHIHELHFSTAFTGQTPFFNAHNIYDSFYSFCKEATKRTKKRLTARASSKGQAGKAGVSKLKIFKRYEAQVLLLF